MVEYIKREDALNAIRKSPISNMSTRLFCVDAIADIPAANVVERKRGKWMTAMLDHEAFGVRPTTHYCSECHQIISFRTFYCPNCGAEMKSEREYSS